MAKTYHFIGIKGSGMSALALMLHQMGHKVQGSDVEKYYFTQRGLEQAGIKILPFDEKNLQGDLEIIAGNAFRPDNNVEIAYADKNGLSYKVAPSRTMSQSLAVLVHMVRPQQLGCFLTSCHTLLILAI